MESYSDYSRLLRVKDIKKLTARYCAEICFVAEYIENEYYNQLVPDDLIRLIFNFYYLKHEILSLDSKYNSPYGFQLTDNSLCAKRVPSEVNGIDGYRHILANTEPVFDDIHCWRVKVSNPRRGWIVFGVAQPKEYQTGKFIHDSPNGGAYGITYYSQYYPDDKYAADRTIDCGALNTAECQIDILLDADKGKMKLCLIGNKTKCEPKMEKLPIKTEKGWVPYFVFGATPMDAVIRLAKIPVDWYGVYKEEIFCENAE